jgi:pimeloyl-ACP methyl ester carboxylesterase
VHVVAVTSEPADTIVGPTTGPEEPDAPPVRLPRLARHLITLEDGHRVGVAICGQGVPLVAAHGFIAEGILYAQTLSRLVDLGFSVIAIDTAGHGGTLGLPTGAANLSSYTDLLARVLDHLGIERAVLMGHSMGGRLVTELAAKQPWRAIAVISLDGVVGEAWDRRVCVSRLFPPLLAGMGLILVADTLTTMPLFQDPVQARKLGRLVLPTLLGHARRPWRMVGPAVSILRSRGSGWMLDRLAEERIPFFAVTGTHDVLVPKSTAPAAARRAHGEVVWIHKGTHSWVLKDPESLPAVMHRLMRGRLGTAVLKAIMDAGIDPHDRDRARIELGFVKPGARVLQLGPRMEDEDPAGDHEVHHRPRYRFTVEAG